MVVKRKTREHVDKSPASCGIEQICQLFKEVETLKMSNWRLLTDPAAMVKNAWKTSAKMVKEPPNFLRMLDPKPVNSGGRPLN